MRHVHLAPSSLGVGFSIGAIVFPGSCLRFNQFLRVPPSFLQRPIPLLLSEYLSSLVFLSTLYSLATFVPLRYNTHLV